MSLSVATRVLQGSVLAPLLPCCLPDVNLLSRGTVVWPFAVLAAACLAAEHAKQP